MTNPILGETKRGVGHCPASLETKVRSLPALTRTGCLNVVVFGWAGYAPVGAPSFELFGAFFPAWLLCGFVGIAGAIAARVLFLKTGLARTFPYQLAVCMALGSVAALLVWMGCFL